FRDFDWISDLGDTVHTAYLGVKAALIPKVLDLRIDSAFSNALGRIETRNPTTPVSGTAAQNDTRRAKPFPAFQDTLIRVEASLIYYFLKNWSARAGYAFEKFDKNDFRTDTLNPFMGVSSIWLGNDLRNYTAHMMGFTLAYPFQETRSVRHAVGNLDDLPRPQLRQQCADEKDQCDREQRLPEEHEQREGDGVLAAQDGEDHQVEHETQDQRDAREAGRPARGGHRRASFFCSGWAGAWQSRQGVLPLISSGSMSFFVGEFRNRCDSPWQPRHREFGYGAAILIGSVERPIVYRHTWPRPASLAWIVPPSP